MTRWEKIIRRDLHWGELCALEAELLERVQAERTRRYLLVSEPRAVYTAGRHADARGLLVTKTWLEAQGIDHAIAPRGGQWTYHGPGQVLVYPIAALEQLGFGSRAVRPFAERFREAVVRTARALGAPAEPRDEPYGVYVRDAKLASFGLSFTRAVTAHGVALYVAAQKEAFSRIDPCGVPRAPVTSLEESGARAEWRTVADGLADAVAGAFP